MLPWSYCPTSCRALRLRYESHAVGAQPVPAQEGFLKNPREVPEFPDDDDIEGRIFLGGIYHLLLEVLPASCGVVVTGSDLEPVGLAVLFALLGLTF